MHIFIARNLDSLLGACPLSLSCMQMAVNPFPWQQEVEAWKKRTAVFAKRVHHSNRPLWNRTHIQTACHCCGNREHNEEDNGRKKPKDRKAANEEKEAEASDDAKRPINVV